MLASQPHGSLLHLDVRAPNLRCSAGTVLALLDWSNALAGDQAPVAADSAAFWIYRLDAAVMLALLFSAEIPDPELGRRAVGRLREVHRQLTRKLTDMT